MTDAEPVESALPDAVEQRVASVVEAIERYGESSIIALAGVPGTGKSFTATIAAQRAAGEPTRVREVQFHPSSSYEEFVEGLRIDASGAVSPRPGILLEWNQLALDNPDLKWVLLIEEFSRANVPSVLGELMTFVEDRNRVFTPMYSRTPTRIAKNLVVLTTFNPADRSALELDNAVLRRLRVLNFPPDASQLRAMLESRLDAGVIEELAQMFENVKAEHPDDFESLMPFGHGIFAEVRAEAPDLKDLWDERIRHLLRRPLQQPHPFTSAIEKAYPWRQSSYRHVG